MAKQNQQVDPVDELDELLEDETEDSDEDEASIIRPEDLARELGMTDGKRVRAFLRQTFPRPADAKNTSWALTQEQADAVRARFTPSDDSEDEVDETEES